MLRHSKNPYTDTRSRPRWARILGIYGPAEARPCTPGDEDSKYGPGGQEQKCTEEGSGGAESLTEHDLLLIHDQARLQHATSPEQLAGLTDAWNAAKQLAFTSPEAFDDPQAAEDIALTLAKMIETRNSKGYRRVPVTFGPGKPPAVAPDKVPQAMKGLWMAFSEQLLEPDEWYKEFEEVHPFEDGNGRLGDLMWKIAKVRKGEEWPTTHPPDFFGTDTSPLSSDDSIERYPEAYEEDPERAEEERQLRDSMSDDPETRWRAESAYEHGYYVDVDKATKENEDYRRVIYTGDNLQLVLMRLLPGEEIGEEVHHLTQFIRVEEGQAKAVVGGEEHDLQPGDIVVVPENTRHNIINTGSEKLKIYTIYTPPQHAPDTVHKTKKEAEEDEDDRPE